MDKRKHRRSRRFLSALMVLAMLVSLMPAGAFATPVEETEITPQWQVSKSKTATNLDANYQSDVTLSLPSASYKGDLDVVFVLDGSTSTDEQGLADEAAKLLTELASYENLQTKAGVVIFGGSNPILYASDLLTIDASNVSTLTDEITNSGYDGMEGRSGSNLQAGVVKAQQMLAGDTTVNAEDKYMIILSDGGARMWYDADAGEAMSIGYWPNETGCWWNSNEDYNARYSLTSGRELPIFTDTWEAGQNGADIDRYGMNQAQSEDPEYAAQYAASSETVMADGYYSTYEAAVYHAALSIKEASQDSKILLVDYPYYPDSMYFDYIDGFKSWLADNEYVTRFDSSLVDSAEEIFSDVRKDLIQVVDQGSYVIDEIGSGSYTLDDKTYDYDFDFVNDIDKLTLTVDGQELTAAPIDQSDATAAWKFGEDSQFELYYYQEGKIVEGQSYGECFVWKINVPIMKDTPVQLTYSVKLSDPQTDAGTHGQYDEDGSKDYAGLLTNNSAILYPVDSLGNANYAPEEFAKPTVSYTAEAVGITPAPITIYTGGNGYTSVVGDDGEEVEEPTTTDTNGLPTPGFYITLPEDINTKLLEVLEGSEDVNENDVIDLSSYLTFTYDDGEETRTWTLERYDNKAGNTSMANGNYIYRINPAKTADGLEPIRLQFTDGKGETKNSDDFEVSLGGLYQQYDMTIYPGDLDQSLVKAVIDVPDKYHKEFDATVGTDKLTIRGVTDEQTATTEIAGHDEAIGDLTNVTAQLTNADTKFYINGSDLEVAPDNEVKLLVDSTVDETGNATMVDHAIDKYDGIITEEHNVELKYLDLVDTTNGNAWVTASAPVTINWPYPDGAEQDDEFYVVHYNGLNRDEGGSLSDIDTNLMEIYAVNPSDGQQKLTKTRQGLQFEVDSFSPFAVYWKEAESDNPGGGPVIVPDDPDEEDPDTPTLNTEDHYSYIVGYPEDYRTGEVTDDESLWPVKPQGNITRAEVATIFYRLLTNDARSENWTTSNDYTDVSADSWYNTPVSTLSAMGIVRGYEDGSFRPNASITRAEFAAIAVRFFESDAVNYEEGLFTDIAGSEWFADAVQAAKDHDIIGGYPDGTFKPNNPITRAEACSIVNRTTKRVPDADHLLALDEMRNWPDNADTSAWYYADMQEATNGHYYDYVLDENDEIVREEWTSERAPIDWEQVEEELEASH